MTQPYYEERIQRIEDTLNLPPYTPPTEEPTSNIPQNLTAVLNSDNSVTLSWDSVANATYSVYSVNSGANPLVSGLTEPKSQRGPFSRPFNYTWWVTATVDGVESEDSNTVNINAESTPPTEEPPPPPTSSGVTLFADNFEDGNISEWDAIQSTPTGHDSSPQTVSGRLELVERASGGTALRIRRPSGDRERTELLPGSVADVTTGDIRTIEVDWLFPTNFPTPKGRWYIVYQQHAGSGSPAFAIEVDKQDQLVIRNNRLNNAPTVIGPIDRGNWHRYAITVRFATDGWVEVRRDGELVVPRTPRNTVPADYAKIGIYTDYTAHDVTSELFIDNFRFSRPQ